MDKKSKILVIIFVVAIFISVFFTYKRAFVDKSFIILEEEASEEELINEEEVVEVNQ